MVNAVLIIKPINEPLSPGDIVGTAFNLLRRNIGFTCKVLLVPTIINALGSIAIQWALTKPAAMQSIAGMGFLFLLGLLGLIVGLIAKWILTLRQMALMRMAGGFSDDWQEAYKTVLDRKWQVVALWILTAIITVAILIAWVVQFYLTTMRHRNDESVMAFLAGLVLLIIAISILCFAAFLGLCLIACDKRNFKDTIDRTIMLISGNFSRCLGFSLALLITIAILSYPLSMPIALLGVWDTYRLGISHNTNEMPIHTAIAGHVWESLITLLISPLFSFAFAVFYVDLLNRKEGLDLRRRLAAITPVSHEDQLQNGTEGS